MDLYARFLAKHILRESMAHIDHEKKSCNEIEVNVTIIMRLPGEPQMVLDKVNRSQKR